MILLEDEFEGVTPITESIDNSEKKKTYICGVFCQAEKKNKNGRVYDLQEMSNEVKRFNDMAKAGNPVLGQLDHPTPQTLDISLKEVAIKIVEMYMDNTRGKGKAEILESTPNGNILKGLIDSGVKVGVSTRGSGQLDENTGRVKNFKMITVDAVCSPSNPESMVYSIQEQIEMYKRGEIVTDLAEAVIHDPIAQKYLQSELKKFISSLVNK